MESNQTAGLNPHLYGIYGQSGIHTAYENNSDVSAGASFRDTFQNALKTTESMESIFAEASERYGVARRNPASTLRQYPLPARRELCS